MKCAWKGRYRQTQDMRTFVSCSLESLSRLPVSLSPTPATSVKTESQLHPQMLSFRNQEAPSSGLWGKKKEESLT